MSAFSAVCDGVRHLFYECWPPGYYWSACGNKASIAGRYLMAPQQGRIVPGYQSRYDASLEPPQAVGAADVPR